MRVNTRSTVFLYFAALCRGVSRDPVGSGLSHDLLMHRFAMANRWVDRDRPQRGRYNSLALALLS